MKNRGTQKRVLIVSAVLLAAIATFVVLYQKTGMGGNRWHDRLGIGMHRSLVLEIIEGNVDLEYKYKLFTILYVPSSARFMRRLNPTSSDPFPSRCMQPLHYSDIGYSRPGMIVETLHELPDLYGYFQLAFDEKDLLCAYTLIGESYSVTFTGGSVRGSHLSRLPELFPAQGKQPD